MLLSFISVVLKHKGTDTLLVTTGPSKKPKPPPMMVAKKRMDVDIARSDVGNQTAENTGTATEPNMWAIAITTFGEEWKGTRLPLWLGAKLIRGEQASKHTLQGSTKVTRCGVKRGSQIVECNWAFVNTRGLLFCPFSLR